MAFNGITIPYSHRAVPWEVLPGKAQPPTTLPSPFYTAVWQSRGIATAVHGSPRQSNGSAMKYEGP